MAGIGRTQVLVGGLAALLLAFPVFFDGAGEGTGQLMVAATAPTAAAVMLVGAAAYFVLQDL